MVIYDKYGIDLLQIIVQTFWDNFYILVGVVFFYIGILYRKYFFEKRSESISYVNSLKEKIISLEKKLQKEKKATKELESKNKILENKILNNNFQKIKKEISEIDLTKKLGTKDEIYEIVKEIFYFLQSEQKKKTLGLTEAVFMMRNAKDYNFFTKENGRIMFERKIEIYDEEKNKEEICHKDFEDLSHIEKIEAVKNFVLPDEEKNKMLESVLQGHTYVYTIMKGLSCIYTNNKIVFSSKDGRLDMENAEIALAYPFSTMYKLEKEMEDGKEIFIITKLEDFEKKEKANALFNKNPEDFSVNTSEIYQNKNHGKSKNANGNKNKNKNNSSHIANNEPAKKEEDHTELKDIKEKDVLNISNVPTFVSEAPDEEDVVREDVVTNLENEVLEEFVDDNDIESDVAIHESNEQEDIDAVIAEAVEKPQEKVIMPVDASSFSSVYDFFNKELYRIGSSVNFETFIFAHLFKNFKPKSFGAYLKNNTNTHEFSLYVDTELFIRLIKSHAYMNGKTEQFFLGSRGNFLHKVFSSKENIENFNNIFSFISDDISIKSYPTAEENGEPTYIARYYMSLENNTYSDTKFIYIQITESIFNELQSIVLHTNESKFLFFSGKPAKKIINDETQVLVPFVAAEYVLVQNHE